MRKFMFLIFRRNPLFIILLFSFLSSYSQSVTSLTLVDAGTDQDLFTLTDNHTIDLGSTGTMLNIRANVSGNPGSVKFEYDEANIGPNGNVSEAIENNAPFALRGDNQGDYHSWTPSTGSHTVTVTPYSEADGGGITGSPYSIDFNVINESSGNSGTGYDPPANPGTGEVTLDGELKKWHKITLSFDGPSHSETDVNPNPFMDYRLMVTFTNGTKSYNVPGYFATDGNAAESSAQSGNIWRVHFTPDATGTWNWEANYRIGQGIAVISGDEDGKPVPPIDGKSGSFTISDTDKTGRDLRAKGRLEYVGGHYLRFAETGEYFLKGGPDAPENFLAYEDFDNTPDNGDRRKSWAPHAGDWNTGDPAWKENLGTEIIGAVNYLASEGLNAFSFLTLSVSGDDKNIFPWVTEGGQQHFDASKLDQWGIVFDHAMEKGMYLHFKTQETENELLLDNGNVGTNRKLYYRELIARYGYHLALNWNLGEENSDQTDQQRKDMAAYISSIDPYHHHIVIHTYPGEQDEIYTPLLGDKSLLTGASVQTGWNNVYASTAKWVTKSAAAGKKWVVANDEQGGANIGVPDDTYAGSPSINDIRKQVLWGNLMAGGAGVEYYFGYSLPHSDLSAQDYRSRDQSWDYVRYALQFFSDNQIPFWTMDAHNELIAGNADAWNFANPGEIYVIYLREGGTVSLQLDNDENYHIKWFNPRTGGVLKDGSVTSVSGTGNHSLGEAPAEKSSDWVVLVTNAAGINQAPQASFSVNKTAGIAPLTVDFDGSASNDPDGSIASWAWDFGDGNTATGAQASHTYTADGNYTAMLTVTDAEGLSSSVVVYIEVTAENILTGCAGAKFEEQNGIVVIEVESQPGDNGWLEENTLNEFTGFSYYIWNGGNNFNSPGNGLLEYEVKINTPGTYRFQWHSKITHGTDPTESNDSWLRIPGADDFFAKNGNSIKYPKGGKFVQSDVVVNGSSSGGWMKVYSSGTTSWTWSTRTSDNDAHQIYATFNNPGVYTIQVSGRSNNHALDRMVLYLEGDYTQAEATSKDRNQMLCTAYDVPPVYMLTINNGSGSGSYKAGESVQIVAGDPEEGMAFYQWQGKTMYLDDPLSAETSVTIPPKDITLTPEYRNATHLQNSIGNNDKVQVFPVPFDDRLHLVAENFEGFVIISDIAGKIRMNQTYFNESAVLDTRNLERGNYILQLENRKGVRKVIPIVKQ